MGGGHSDADAITSEIITKDGLRDDHQKNKE